MPNVSTINVEQFNAGIFFRMSMSSWPGRAKCRNVSKLQEYLALLNAPDGEKAGADLAVEGAPNRGAAITLANATKTTKVLLHSPALDAIRKHLSESKAALVGPFGKASPSRITESLFICAKTLVPEFEAQLNAANDKLTLELIPAFVTDYEAAKDRARTEAVKKGGLGPLYDPTDYPPVEEIEEMFALDWQWLALGVPDDLPESLRAAANEKFQRQMQEAADEVKEALRVSLGDFVGHLVERLQPSEDGKPKVFRDTLIGNVAQFCEVFDARNIMNDAELKTLVDRAKTLIAGVTPDKLREYSSVKENTLAGFTEIKTQLDAMITERKSRKITLTD